MSRNDGFDIIDLTENLEKNTEELIREVETESYSERTLDTNMYGTNRSQQNTDMYGSGREQQNADMYGSSRSQLNTDMYGSGRGKKCRRSWKSYEQYQ